MPYPQGTEEFLKFVMPGADPALSDIPETKEDKKDKAHQNETHVEHDSKLVERDHVSNTVTLNISQVPFKKIAKTALPYVLIFTMALGFYFLFFTDVSLKSLFPSRPASSVEVAEPEYQNLNQYYAWINAHYFQVTDPEVLAPGNDISGNGLTNYQKYVLGLNPKKYDTLGLGVSDTQSIISGINPSTGRPYTEEQKKLIAQYVDLEIASNKLALNAAQQANAPTTNTATYEPQVAGTYTNDFNRSQAPINTTINAKLDIPSLSISVPIVWTQDVKNFENDLKSGVVHYPGTAMPGQIGTAYISGHSSNFAWSKGNYNRVFDVLGELKQYASFSITTTDTQGKQVVYHYVVTHSNIYKADDQEQFQNTGKSVVALSTCWPIGTSEKRLVVFAELSQVDR